MGDKFQLDHIGVHCSVSDCNLKDFLPYKCKCGNQYCHDHRDPEKHGCVKEKINKTVYPCPICNALIKSDTINSIDEVISRHIDSGECGKVKSNVPKSYACSLKGCKNTEFVKVLCEKCKVNYCLKHRFPSSHSCPDKPIPIEKKLKNNTTTKNTTSINNNNTTNTNTNTNKITSDSQYHSEQKKQKNDLTSLREEQKQRYLSGDLGEIRIIQTNGYRMQNNFRKTDTLRTIKDFINQNRTDGNTPYAICKDSNGQYPFPVSQLDLDLQQLNLLPISTLYMISLDDGNRINNTSHHINSSQQQNEGFLSYLNPFRYFK